MNEFVDMHVHSKFSIDGMSTMEDYCLIAGYAGLPAMGTRRRRKRGKDA